MQLIYQGTDITNYVEIAQANHRDAASGRCDALEITLESASDWFRWQPVEDDTIRVTHDGYDTGTLYLNRVYPEDGRYTIHATSLPSSARKKAWKSYEGLTLTEIVSACASEAQFGYELYGMERAMRYDYLLRKDEGCAAFLNRIAEWECAFLKCYDGSFRLIGLDFAQSLAVTQTIELMSDQKGARYMRDPSARYSGVTVITPLCKGLRIHGDERGTASRHQRSSGAQ